MYCIGVMEVPQKQTELVVVSFKLGWRKLLHCMDLVMVPGKETGVYGGSELIYLVTVDS
jgi:hypothetical protein